MQRNFNPHVPPGYFETHELDGVNWKTEEPVRRAVSERMVAQAVKKFERESRRRWTGSAERRYAPRCGGPPG